ncbi:thioredoxin domain-containing protein [Flavobacterium sp.]|jgi:thioredoxin|uniref:thioredoxin domain-containing protein n=1 Tax=Flavobacterium sp. TaxID=239 RepID=UPI0022C397A0|nr:thioredoxin domain-containing protein [Flavobacterium sp.]MCZ8143667.1 thioredoxin domain-containing protein [Flavobacterium sp.]MCZ8368219.1 thioredoxin domain-containing protein [Flavobacterium sp.]
MKKIILAVVSLVMITASCQKKGTESNEKNTASVYETLDVQAFATAVKKQGDVQIIDVRTPEEFAAGHLEKAQNLNWNAAEEFEKGIAQLDRSKPVYVYCLAGSRSTAAAQKLQEMGFTSIYELAGGYQKWRAAGLADAAPAGGMTQSDFDKLLDTDKKVLVDFYTTWCGPCKKLKPTLDKIATEMSDKVVVVRIDAEKNLALAEALNVEGYPTLMVYENKKQVWRYLGYLSEEELKKQLQ